MAALFVALGGAGVAASLALVRAPQATMQLTGSVSLDGLVSGPRLTGNRVSEGVYSLTIAGDTFAPTLRTKHLRAFVSAKLPAVTDPTGAHSAPPICEVASEAMASNGSATAEVDCITFDPGTLWEPADASFDVLFLGPSR